MPTVHSQLIGITVQGLLAAASLCAVLSCASPTRFQPSSHIPSAAGNFAAKLDDNGNSWVEVEFEHLALPASLNPPRATYVAWAESHFGRKILLGQLRVDEDRTAAWRGTVPFDQFRLLLTAEDLPWPEDPREPILLKTDFIKPSRGAF